MILKAIKYFLKMKAKGVNVISICRIKGHRIRVSDKHLASYGVCSATEQSGMWVF